MACNAQQVVKQFVQSFVKGRQIRVVAGYEEEEDCLITIDRQLTALSLQKGRFILLSKVEQICVGLDAEEQVVDLPIDELCVTFLFEDGRDVAFRFLNMEERDTFAICISMFVDKLRGSSAGEDTEHLDNDDEEMDCQKTEHTASTSVSSTPPSGANAKTVVKQFVQRYVKGQQVAILSTNGGTTECIATLDRKLTSLSIQRPGGSKKRHIPLEAVEEISIGTEAEDEVDLPLDDNCVTLLLEDGQGVGVSFSNVEERDTFALCISMFVNSRRGERSRKHFEGK